MNLLTDPVFRTETDRGRQTLNLPALLSALGDERIHTLSGIQRHQVDAFHVFLCSLATCCLARSGHTEPRQPEGYWREALRDLAGEAGEHAWILAAEDLNRSAFMQPPLPARDHAHLRPSAATPDALDLLPTAKNHDLKQNRAAVSHPDHWVYALVSLQTMSGYFGRGNPGIARMNSGFGNRPVVELAYGLSLGQRWLDAVARLLVHRRMVLDGPWGYDPNGIALVWTCEWDGKTAMRLDQLDPNHVEICRRVRLVGTGGQLSCLSIPADAPRIDAKELNGMVGDAWLPVDLGVDKPDGKAAEPKALTVSPKGLTADLLRRIVFKDRLEMSALQQPLPDRQGDLWLCVSVLIRGQGTTEGYHERRIPIPARMAPRLFGAKARLPSLASLARSAIEVCDVIQNRVLKPALFVALEGAPEQIKFDRDSAQAWWERFAASYTTAWSDAYFPWLWSMAEQFDADARLDEWTRLVRGHALRVLHDAFLALPQHRGRRWRTRSEAERVFIGAFYNQFPHLKEDRNDRTGNP